MPRSRSRSRERRRSRDKRSRSRDRKRRDRSHSREKHHKKDRGETSRYDRRDRDRSSERHYSSRHRDKSADRYRKRDDSRDRRRDRSSSRSRKQRRSPDTKKHSSTSNHSGSQPSSSAKLDSIQMPNDESCSSTEPTKKFDPRNAFEISNEFSREGFEQFTRDHGIDFSNIETEEDRNAVHEKMEEVLKAHFAAQGKIYPPPKVEKPLINAATGFANDGSFMEQFKKMQDDYKLQLEAERKRKLAEERLKSLPIRRRGGGKILKTGIVAKKTLNEDGSEVQAASDPWSMYLKEVQKYKNSSCDSDSKTRPLVK